MRNTSPVVEGAQGGYDFVIVGSGAGAVAAALMVRDAGGSPLIIEKTDKFGGSTALSGGVLWVPNSDPVRRAGFGRAPEHVRSYLDACAGSVTPGSTPERREAFLAEGPGAVAFIEGHGVKFRHVNGYADYHHNEHPGGSPNGCSLIVDVFDLRRLGSWAEKLRLRDGPAIPMTMADLSPLMLKGRTVRSLMAMMRVGWRIIQNKLGRRLVGTGAALQGRLLEAALDKSTPIWLDAEVTGFQRESGRVVGVTVRKGERELQVRATRGVLIDAGGFSHDVKWRAELQPKGARPELSLANPGDTGEMIREAVALGAAVDLMDLSWWIPVSRTPEGAVLVHTSDIAKPHSVVVDRNGRRFVNETTSYVAWGLKYLEQGAVRAGPCWFIFDHEYVRKYRFGGLDPQPLMSRLGLSRQDDKFPAQWFSSGFMKKAASLDELARQCELPLDQLRTTVDRLNGFAANGVDLDFGRGRGAYHRWCGDTNQKPNANLGPISSAPFYAVQIGPGDVGTAGGLVADSAGRVMDKSGAPIPGLYATGNATASVVGRSYPGAGASIAASIVFGIVAARHAMTS